MHFKNPLFSDLCRKRQFSLLLEPAYSGLQAFDFRHKLDDPPFDARQAAIQRGLLFRDGEEIGFMKVGIFDSADIDGIVTEIDYSPPDEIVLMLIVAAD